MGESRKMEVIAEKIKHNSNIKRNIEEELIMAKKVLWFSRHEMTDEQRGALGDCEITQISKTINSAYELADEIAAADIVAIVAPINIQAQFLKLAGDKPVITAKSQRLLVHQDDGSEDKVVFQFEKWERLVKIEVVTEDFVI